MKLSIITINYNNKDGLKKTIESVVSQTFKDFQYIIIDGGSTDGSLEIIQHYNQQINYWVSESDKGIYNAQNKGILVATGEYLLFLNSGDWLCSEEVIKRLLEDIDGYDIIYGNQYFHFANGRIVEDRFSEVLTFYFLAFYSSLPHQASLIRRTLLIEMGLYDETLKIASDWKFFLLAIFKRNCKYLHKDFFVTNYNMEGIHTDPEYKEIQLKEREEVINAEFYNFKYIESQSPKIIKLSFYYEYSRLIRFLKMMRILKKFDKCIV